MDTVGESSMSVPWTAVAPQLRLSFRVVSFRVAPWCAGSSFVDCCSFIHSPLSHPSITHSLVHGALYWCMVHVTRALSWCRCMCVGSRAATSRQSRDADMQAGGH